MTIDHVHIVGPMRGRRWLSIQRYGEVLSTVLREAGIRVTVGEAPWLNPESVAKGYLRRYWEAEGFMPTPRPGTVVHIADHALGHHVARFRRHPVVVTNHVEDPVSLPEFDAGSLRQWTRIQLNRPSLNGMKRADSVFCVSEEARRGLLASGIEPDRTRLVPFVLGHEFQPEGPPPTVGLPADPWVLSVGITRPYKNLELLIKAMSTDVLATVPLVRAGEPLTRDQRRLAERLDVAGRIVELGWLSWEELAAVYRRAPVLVQPSVFEGFGVPVAEAMACGTPVVASDGGAIPEVAGNGASIFALEPRRGVARRLAAAIRELLDDTAAAAALSKKAIARADVFRPESVLPQLLAGYDDAVARSLFRRG